ncbi:hypothetical protein HDU93_005083, partial [Gonapodya sp. JEL0774]
MDAEKVMDARVGRAVACPRAVRGGRSIGRGRSTGSMAGVLDSPGQINLNGHASGVTSITSVSDLAAPEHGFSNSRIGGESGRGTVRKSTAVPSRNNLDILSSIAAAAAPMGTNSTATTGSLRIQGSGDIAGVDAEQFEVSLSVRGSPSSPLNVGCTSRAFGSGRALPAKKRLVTTSDHIEREQVPEKVPEQCRFWEAMGFCPT